MNDLFDIAKPVRDAVIAEIDRALPADVSAADREGLRLGTHLVAVLAAFGTRRLQVVSGIIEDRDLRDVLALAIGQLVANTATTFRPVRNGKPLSPTQSAALLLHEIAEKTYRQTGGFELGLAEVHVPLALDKDGVLGTKAFDVMDMLGRAKP